MPTELKMFLISGKELLFNIDIISNSLFDDIINYLQINDNPFIDKYNLNIIYNNDIIFKFSNENFKSNLDLFIKYINDSIICVVNIIYTNIPKFKYYYDNTPYTKNLDLYKNNFKKMIIDICNKHINDENNYYITIYDFKTNERYYTCNIDSYYSMSYNIKYEEYENELCIEMDNFIDIQKFDYETLENTIFKLEIDFIE